MIDKDNLKAIINDLKEVIKSEYLIISQETLFNNACTYQRGNLANQSKEKKNLEPITDKQCNFLNKNEAELVTLGFDLNNIQTKSDASKIINEFLQLKNKRQNGNKTY